MELSTCELNYYKHTQSIFAQMLSKKIAYKTTALVNWDPIDKTVLANEQIDSEGRAWRTGAQVEKKQLS